MRLTELKKNSNGKILALNTNNIFKERLLEVGFAKGTRIKFIFEFNSTFAYEIKNTIIALRKEDAQKILIEDDISCSNLK